jgi:hypothetical protein
MTAVAVVDVMDVADKVAGVEDMVDDSVAENVEDRIGAL